MSPEVGEASPGTGNSKTTDSSTPVLVSGVTNVTQVSAGDEHSCAFLHLTEWVTTRKGRRARTRI